MSASLPPLIVTAVLPEKEPQASPASVAVSRVNVWAATPEPAPSPKSTFVSATVPSVS